MQDQPTDILGLIAAWGSANVQYADASRLLTAAKSSGDIAATLRAEFDLDQARFDKQRAIDCLMAMLHTLLRADRAVYGDNSLSARIERLEERLEQLEEKRVRKAVGR